MSDITWRLRRYQKGDKDKIIALRKIVFKDEDVDKENIDFWNWEFENNYAGQANVFLAVDNDNVVGHYAVCPSNILIDSKIKKGSIVVDVMTHPEYRFQGMFTKIGRYSLNESGNDGIDFSYGFPIRKTVIPGHLKVGWKIAFKLPVYVYPINFTKLIYKFIPIKVLAIILGSLPQCLYTIAEKIRVVYGKKYIFKVADHFEKSKELEDFIEKTKTQHKIMQYRNYEFLKWRYNDNKYRKYKIFFAYNNEGEMLGYIVLRRTVIYGLDCITIIDIQALQCKKSVINALLRCAHKYAKNSGAALVGCMINKNIYKQRMLNNFYIKSPYIFKFIIHPNRDLDYENELLKNQNWFITWADTDDL